MIPEIDIWRAANLMLKRYGAKAFEESSTRADELAADGDHDGASSDWHGTRTPDSRRATAITWLIFQKPRYPI